MKTLLVGAMVLVFCSIGVIIIFGPWIMDRLDRDAEEDYDSSWTKKDGND